MIASQGPLKNSNHRFWKMIVQENVTKVVSLFQDNQDYFPTAQIPTLIHLDDLPDGGFESTILTLDNSKTEIDETHFVKKFINIQYQSKASVDAPLI